MKHVGIELARGMLFDWFGESEDVADQTLPRILKTIEGKERAELLALRGPLVAEMLEQARPETLRLLHLHSRMGRDSYVVSASAIEIVEELAAKLGFTGAIATEVTEFDDPNEGLAAIREDRIQGSAVLRIS